jgi:hypothetical protein
MQQAYILVRRGNNLFMPTRQSAMKDFSWRDLSKLYSLIRANSEDRIILGTVQVVWLERDVYVGAALRCFEGT